MIRVDEHCKGESEETVLAHWRDSSTGMSQKDQDLLAAWSCYSCHTAVDGQRKTRFTQEELERFHLDGIIRTQRELIKNKIVKW